MRDSVTVITFVAETATDSPPIAALLPVLLLAVAFVGYCLYDLARAEVRYLPKWLWAVICVISIPVGGIVYLIVERRFRR